MKIKNIILPIAALVFTACAAPQEKDDMPYGNTVKIDPGDSHEQIVAKAAHVVPNSRQMDALENEFIAFVPFHIRPERAGY